MDGCLVGGENGMKRQISIEFGNGVVSMEHLTHIVHASHTPNANGVFHRR